MKSTEHDPAFDSGVGRAERFDNLRAAYHVRLADDRLRLMKLRRQFERLPIRPKPLYDDIRRFAHGMAGAAAVFEVPPIETAASLLEDAVLAAAIAPSERTDAGVHEALESMERVLTKLIPIA